jgi:hypothetical protein
MVRRDAVSLQRALWSAGLIARCTSPAGASPAPVSVGAPGSRPQVLRGDPHARAGCQKPAIGTSRLSRERAHGPQHQVKPAASTNLQSGGRAAHVTAKAMLTLGAPKLEVGSGGVGGAARVSGGVWNTRDPSAQPQFGRGGSYKPKAKSSTVQRESEGIVVLKTSERSGETNAVTNNAAGGKGPCGDRADGAGKREGMAGMTGPNDLSGVSPSVKARELPRWLGVPAKLGGAGLAPLCAMRPPDGSLVSRVPEIGTHGLNGGLGFMCCLRVS